MRLQSLVLASLASAALAQNETILDALMAQPSLSNLTTYIQLFPSFVSQLSELTDITFLAPSNEAFALAIESDQGIASNADLVEAIFSYHILNGTYTNFSTDPQFVSTYLLPGAYANVTGGQVVEALGSTDQDDSSATFYAGLLQNSTTIMGESAESNMTNSTEGANATESTAGSSFAIPFAGGIIQIIDRFLVLPSNLTNTAVQINLQAAVGALQATNLSDPLDTMVDVTCFVPDNAAFQAIGGSLVTSSIEELTNILQYHVVNGSTLYSTGLENNTTLTAMNGIGLDITIGEDGDIFVNSARVLTPNVLVANGVIHVIDNVLNPGNRTAEPDPVASTQAPAFTDASSASEVPFTSGVATATSSINTEGPSSASSAATETETATSSGGAMPRQTGAVAAAALFGGAAALMNL